MNKFLFKNISIIGFGLMGGSLAKACKKYNVSENVFGFDIDKNQIEFALQNKIIDGIYNFNQSITNDLIIISSSLLSYEKILKKLETITSEKTTIIDIGSLQNFPLKIARKILQEKSKNFTTCHPIAGSEKSGVSNSNIDLFLGKKIFISKSTLNDENQIKKISEFWQKIGSNPEFISTKEHDKIFSLVSHLPQFLSFAAKEDFQNTQNDDQILNRHFRLQNSNPKMWQEIFDLNHDNIEYYLKLFLKNIDEAINLLNEEKYQESHSRRSILVSCFLNIADIKKYQKYSGSGFADFTAINRDQKNNLTKPKILDENKESLIQFLNNLKSKIHELN
ncbi:MAG: prephenate dehydrogenase [Rickettsiales bacterium]|jgi:prephenate dehydrogenase